MAQTLARGLVLLRRPVFATYSPLGNFLASIFYYEKQNSKFEAFWDSNWLVCHYRVVDSQYFCTSAVQYQTICWGGSTQVVLLRNIEIALNNHRIDDAWDAFRDFRKLYGFPVDDSVVVKMITQLCYSENNYWLQKACDLVFAVLKEKPNTLKSDTLIKLSLSLARAQRPLLSSTILRLMLEKNILLPIDVLLLVFHHLVKTEPGTCLASNFLIQVCDWFMLTRCDHPKLAKPDTLIFNIVLDACLRFESSVKAQKLIELMSKFGVIADAHSMILFARIHEMNGQRDELKILKVYADRAPTSLVSHYRQFYDSMLSLQFKFDDIDAAAELILEMHTQPDSSFNGKILEIPQKPCFVPIGSQHIRNGLKLQIMPELLKKDSVFKVETKQQFVVFQDGKLLPSEKALAKIINGYKRNGEVSKLSRLLLRIQEWYDFSWGCNISSNVIDACIRLGWLETAHDILDDMKLDGKPMGLASYMSLLRAYLKADMHREADVLVKQMKRAGFIVNREDEVTDQLDLVGNSDLADCLVREASEEETVKFSKVHELDSSIYFFCKAKMMGDALKTYKRMQKMNVEPTTQTFVNLIYVYSSMEMYRDITILWGDIKRYKRCGSLSGSKDLYELLLLNFIRGGYFERVMEVIDDMKLHHMFIDKGMYKSEYLKFHKNLYRRLKQSDAITEAQSKRVEYVGAFRKWAGLD